MAAKFHENHSKCEMMHPVTNPLADLVICERCGERMICQSSATQPAQLVCSNYPHCDNQSSPFELVEKMVLASLHDWLEHYETSLEAQIFPNETFSKVETLTGRIRNLKRVMEKIEKQIVELHNRFERKIYDKATLRRKEKELIRRKTISKKALVKFQQQLEKEKKRIRTHNDILPKIKYVLHIYSHLDDPKQKNALLKQVLETCTYRKDRTQTNGELTVKIYPKVKC